MTDSPMNNTMTLISFCSSDCVGTQHMLLGVLWFRKVVLSLDCTLELPEELFQTIQMSRLHLTPNPNPHVSPEERRLICIFKAATEDSRGTFRVVTTGVEWGQSLNQFHSLKLGKATLTLPQLPSYHRQQQVLPFLLLNISTPCPSESSFFATTQHEAPPPHASTILEASSLDLPFSPCPTLHFLLSPSGCFSTQQPVIFFFFFLIEG